MATVDSTITDSFGSDKFNTRPNEKYIIRIDETSEINGDKSEEIRTNSKPIDKGIWLIHAK